MTASERSGGDSLSFRLRRGAAERGINCSPVRRRHSSLLPNIDRAARGDRRLQGQSEQLVAAETGLGKKKEKDILVHSCRFSFHLARRSVPAGGVYSKHTRVNKAAH